MLPKLVRDNIPHIIAQDIERTAIFYEADDKEYWQLLKAKLLEEVYEFLTGEELIEIADILEVIEALLIFKNISITQIQHIKEKKAQSHGTFSKRIVLSALDKL